MQMDVEASKLQRDVTYERKKARGMVHTWHMEYNAEVLLHNLASALSSHPGTETSCVQKIPLRKPRNAKFSADYILKPPCHKSFLQHAW